MGITQKFNEWCSKNLPLSAPGKEVEASDKMLEFFQSEITAAEQRGRNEVLDEIERKLPKEKPDDVEVVMWTDGEMNGYNKALFEVKSIIQNHKV